MKKGASNWQVEAQSIRNVAEAIARVLREVPAGGAIATLRAALGEQGISARVFDRAVEVLLIQRRVRQAGHRLLTMKE